MDEHSYPGDQRSLLVLWPTGRCNLECRYCYAAGVSSQDMDLATACQAIDRMEGPLSIQFAGGEPLLNIGLVEAACAYAAARHDDVLFSIQTNGSLIDRQAIEVIKRYRIAIGVSLDGRPETNEHLRGDTFEVIKGINSLYAAGLAININAVVSNYNALRLTELVDMAVFFGNVNGIGLDLLRASGLGAGPQASLKQAAGDDLRQGLIHLYAYARQINAGLAQKVIIREFEKARILWQAKQPPPAYCYAAQGRSFVVLPNGDCYPCGSLAHDRGYFMGNIHDSFQALAIACDRPEGCSSCEYGGFCPGGCPARGLLDGGFDELDCVMRKTSFDLIKEEA
ncbi:MAG: radical SAM protein [Coriobacteriia bacterium]|nr:radical SAM protein [Coriobacteriia bacterium]